MSRKKSGRAALLRSTRLFACCLIGLLLLSTTSLANAGVWLEINGVDDELAKNVRVTIGQPVRLTESSMRLSIDAIPEQASQALSAYGYFSADITAEHGPGSILIAYD